MTWIGIPLLLGKFRPNLWANGKKSWTNHSLPMPAQSFLQRRFCLSLIPVPTKITLGVQTFTPPSEPDEQAQIPPSAQEGSYHRAPVSYSLRCASPHETQAQGPF